MGDSDALGESEPSWVPQLAVLPPGPSLIPAPLRPAAAAAAAVAPTAPAVAGAADDLLFFFGDSVRLRGESVWGTEG